MNFIGNLAVIVIQIYCTQILDLHATENSNCLNSHSNDQELAVLTNNVDKFVKSIMKNGTMEIEKVTFDTGPCSVNVSNPTSNIKHQILEQIQKIRKLLEDVNSSQINNCIIEKLSHLEENLEELENMLEDPNSTILEETKKYQKQIIEFERAVACYEERINKIQNSINKEKRDQVRLRAAIVRDIKSRAYEDALKKLEELDGEFRKNINDIVHEVYNNKTFNFELILRFGGTSDNATINLAVHQALNFEMEANRYKDYKKILKLIDSLTRNVIGRERRSKEVNEEKNLKSKLHKSAKDLTVQELTNRLIRSSNRYYLAVTRISKDIYTYYPILYGEVISQTLNSVIDKIDAESLIKFFMKHDYAGQSIFGYSAIFKALKSRNRLNESTTVSLAFGLKEALAKNDSDSRAEGEKLKESLPKSVRNLAFSTKVCFKNAANNEYMYAANTTYDSKRRRVLSWRPGDMVYQGLWNVIRDGGIYLLKNTEHNEYLYAANDYFAYDRKRRSVFTWIPGDKVTQGHWIFIPDGDDVFIKNTEHSEYLLADNNVKYDSDRHYVFTWRPKNSSGDHLWRVEDCSRYKKG